MDIFDCLRCDNCDNKLRKLSFNNPEIDDFDGELACDMCKRHWFVSGGVVLNTKSETNDARINALAAKYGRQFHFVANETAYTTQMELRHDSRKLSGGKILSRLKKILNFTYYILAFVFIYTFIILSRRPCVVSDTDKDIQKKLAEFYFFVPEMAIWKWIELKALRSEMIDIEELGVVLDIGGGDGLVFGLAINGLKTKATINSDLFAYSSGRYSITLSEDSTNSLVGKGSIDTVMSINSLEHIKNADVLLKNFYSYLRPLGKIIFSTPNPDYHEGHILYRIYKKLRLDKWSERYKKWEMNNAHHCSINTENTWQTYLLEAGFSNIKIVPFFSIFDMLLFDLLNLSAKLPSEWNFWQLLYVHLSRHRLLKLIMIRALNQILCRLPYSSTSDRNSCTHLLCIAEK